ncbi:SDR family NAD(P)-dependent oxidoreductase [Arthrobacter bambusae]|uniref:SDR family NAD(P)-dependent oxidoreductase n=1 Tax=Arthrobacter bambusae TaxID=1338426 RepID=UPI00277D8306|nr:SDR family oxidoreductase [Arthrobacter bambusae]MDQ0240299.1 NAD(P)-dependent dehydrogenase (short-subunit alcohol dehydrogenase family) [Arthrobacter bambusae]
MSDFKGKTAIVTGGGSGLGEAISKDLAKNGVNVVVVDINRDAATRVSNEIIAAGGTAVPFQGNTAVAEDSKKAVDFAVASYGAVAAPGNAAYTAAKHGVVGLTKNAAAEYGAQGLRVNAIGPRYIDTPLLAAAPKEVLNGLEAKHPFGRLGQPEEIANVTTFLLSDKASFMTGSYVLVDGGYTAV